MVLKVLKQRNELLMVSTFFDLGNGITHSSTRRNVSRETFRDEVTSLVDSTFATRNRLVEVIKGLDLPVRGNE